MYLYVQKGLFKLLHASHTDLTVNVVTFTHMNNAQYIKVHVLSEVQVFFNLHILYLYCMNLYFIYSLFSLPNNIMFNVVIIQIQKGKGCPQSIPTINEVYACPKTILEWTKAKERKQCNLIRQNCTTKEDFEYHCLPNAVLGMFVELCAPSKIIVGKTEFRVLVNEK